jgi:small subunit ribosomal protein S1
VGETVAGIVRSIEDYGVFIELTPNFAGLAELPENMDDIELYPNQQVSVYIKSLNYEKMKVKLVIVDTNCDYAPVSQAYHYTQTSGRVDEWIYSTPESYKRIWTRFD